MKATPVLQQQVATEVATGFEAHAGTVGQTTSGMRVPASEGYGEPIERVFQREADNPPIWTPKDLCAPPSSGRALRGQPLA